jgi:hypothetical protein
MNEFVVEVWWCIVYHTLLLWKRGTRFTDESDIVKARSLKKEMTRESKTLESTRGYRFEFYKF